MSTKLGTLTLDLVARIGSFTQGMRQASTTADREMRRVENSVIAVDSLIKKLAVTAGATFSVAQISSYADSYIGLQNRLKLVTTSQQELTQATNDTYKISQETAQSWDSTVQVYQRFAQNAKALGINLSQAALLTETVTKAISISGGTAESSEAALVQFGQALSSGVLRGEEFNSISEQAGGLRDAIARGLNLSVGDLRKWANEGKLTAGVVIKALEKAGVSVADLFNKTDFTGAQGWVLVQDAAIKKVGEFSKATGASQALFESLKYVSENMSAVTNTMMIGATFMAGTYIPVIYGAITAGYARTKQMVEQTAIQYAAINAERAAAASSLAQAQAQLVNTQSTLAALAAEKALEVQRLQAQINAIGRMASTTRMAQLRQIEVQVTAELTAAETALAAARARSTAAAATSVGVGRAAIGILSGPVGMGITLAAVAAGYLLMKDGADKATSSIDIQGQSVADLVKKYRELNTLQRDNETKALAEQVQDLAVKFRVASSDLSSFMQALPASDEKIDFFVKLTKEYQNGKISSDAYYKAVKDVNFLTDEQLDKVRSLVGRYGEAKGKFNAAEVAQDALSKAMTGTTQKAKEQAAQVAGLSEEIKKLLGANAEGANKSNYLKEMVNLKVDPKLAEMLYEARKAEGLEWGKNQVLSDAVRKSVFDRWKADQGLNKTLEERAKIEEKNKKFIEAQGAAMKVNAEVAKAAAKYNFASIEAKNNLPKGLISATIMQESKGSIYNSKGGVLTSPSGAQGPAQFMPDTAKRFNVDVTSMKSSAEGVAKYYVRLLDLFDGDLNKAISAYHAGEGNVQRGTNIGPINRQYVKNIKGYMAGASGVSFDEDYSFDDWLKEQEQFAIEREKREKEMAARQKEISLNIASEEVRIRSKLADDLKDINESGFDDAEKTRLISEYQRRADIDIQIAQANHDDKLSIYSDYLKTEETLTSESFARRQRDLKLDLTLSADDYTAASLALENQRKKEIESLRRDEKFEVLEAKRDWMDKGEYAQQYYALIREEILNTASYSPEMKSQKLNFLNLDTIRSGVGKNFSDPNDTESQFLHSVDYATIQKSNTQWLDEEFQKQQEQMLANYENVKSLNADNHAVLLEAEREFLDAKQQLQDEYDFKAQDARRMDYENQLSMYNSMISMTGGVFGELMGIVSQYKEENTKTYKTMFALQKVAALSQAIVSTELAAIQVMADPTALTMSQKLLYAGIIRATGYMSAGIIAGQAIAGPGGEGYADGGFTGYGGKYEQAGIVHKGEGVLTQEEIAALGGPAGFYALRESIKNGFSDGGLVLDAPKVLNPSQNKDLTNYLSQAQSNNNQAANVNLNPNFVIVDERQSLGDYLYGPDGKKAFVKFFKQNRRELGFA
jgi:tape measure domain-containing protein